MKYVFFCLIGLTLLFSCKVAEVQVDVAKQKVDINYSLEAWHKAAAEANFDAYFNLMTTDGVFIGTDATENWQNNQFKAFAKPYFDKGKAWRFTTISRNIYVYENQKLAWFDELLDTQMEICRGSGIVEKVGDVWKVKHYVLSIAIPNDNVSEVTNLKKVSDSILKLKLLKNY